MPAVLHLAWFDLRRARWMALLWAAVYLSAPLLDEHLARSFEPPVDPPTGPLDGGVASGAPFVLGVVVEPLLAWLLTAVVVQADPVRDGRAFWRTRPIPPRTLLLGKATVLALLLIGVPILIAAGRFATYGAPVTALIVMGLQLALSRGAWMGIGLVVAALTGTMVRFVLTLVGVVTLSITTLLLVVQWLAGSAQGVGSVSAGFWGIGPGVTGVAPLTVILGGSLVAAVLAYAQRWRVIPIVVLLSAVLLGDGPLGDQGLRRIGRGLAPDLAARVDEAAVGQPVRMVPSWRVDAATRNERPLQLLVRFALPALPPHYTADLPEPRGELQLADGTRLTGSGQSTGGMHEFGARNVVAGTSWCDDATTPFCGRDVELRLLELDERERMALERGGGRLVVTGDLHVAQHRAVALLPLRRGVALRRPGYLLEVLSVAQQSFGLSLGGRVTRFASFASGPLPHLDLFARRGSVVSPLAMVPSSLPALPLIDGPTHSPLSLRVWGADIQAPFVASLGQRQLPSRIEPKADWSRDVELIVVESTYIGSTPVRWTADHLRIVETSEPSSP